MKEELQGKLVEILTSIQAAAGKASDFAMEQLPDIAQSYIVYGRAYTMAIAVVAALIFLSGFYVLHLVAVRVRAADAEYAKDKAEQGANCSPRRHYFEASDLMPLQLVPFVIGAMIFGLNASQLLLVWFAPKVWLLKEIAYMVR